MWHHLGLRSRLRRFAHPRLFKLSRLRRSYFHPYGVLSPSQTSQTSQAFQASFVIILFCRVAEEVGDFVDVFDEIGVESLDEEGDDFVTDFVAFDGDVAVRGVLAPFFAVFAQVVLEFGVAATEEGADEFDGSDLGDRL